MGIISSIGMNLDEFEFSLASGATGVCLSDRRQGLPSIYAPIKRFNFLESLNGLEIDQTIKSKAKAIVAKSAISTQAAVIAALQAWIDGGMHEVEFNPSDIGIVVAGQNFNSHQLYNFFNKYKDSYEYIPPSLALEILDTNLISILSEILDISGHSLTVGNASATGNMGLIQGAQLICHEVIKYCLVVSPFTEISPLEYSAWKNMGVIFDAVIENPKTACRPFDQERMGFVYGQGAGAVLLSKHGEVKPVSPICAITGYGTGLDRSHLPAPSSDGQIKAMADALKMANLDVSNVEYINAHGTASILGDETELYSIKMLFKNELQNIWVNSSKCLLGHCLHAAGLIETIATVVQIKSGFIHGNINISKPISNEVRLPRVKIDQSITTAIKNAYGFGGINTSTVIQRMTMTG